MKKLMVAQLRYSMLLVSLILVGCSTAPRIVGPVHPAIRSSAVMVYEPPLVPRHYSVVAKLNAMDYGGLSSPRMDRILLQKMRKQAAQLGANGILLIPIRGTSGGAICVEVVCNAFHTQVHAEAIYVPH